MSITTRTTDLKRRTFILAGAAGALAAAWTLSQAHAQPAAANLNFRTTGTQSPSLILVHGFCCSLEDWDAQVQALSANFRCAVLDLPGHGSSAMPTQVSIAAMAAAVNHVKQELGPGRKILIGHSMGCRVIAEAYIQSRADVAGLVFVDGSILGGDPETAVSRAKERARAGIDRLTEDLFNNMFVEGSDPAVRERLIARAKKVDPLLREELFVDMVRWDLTHARDALKQITVPVLVLQSTYLNNELQRAPLQPGMTTPWMDAIAASVPKSQAKVVANAGHFTMIDAAKVVSEAIGEFARRLGDGALHGAP